MLLDEVLRATALRITRGDYFAAVIAAVLDTFPQIREHQEVMEFHKRLKGAGGTLDERNST